MLGKVFVSRRVLLATLSLLFSALAVSAQEPVIVQPGAPGQASKTLPSDTRAKLPPASAKDVEFMQGMIMHHAQAVEMVALMPDRTERKDLRLLGSRISQSQSSEMNFMKQWLKARGESTEMKMDHMSHDMDDMDMSSHNAHAEHAKKPAEAGTQNAKPPEGGTQNTDHQMLMPGMLTAKQMAALKNAKGEEFDRLFLTGMIQHHGGALTMVKDLFNTAGAGQDAQIFNFATDVDSGQRAEIKIMQKMLGENP
jgi:uncharacterized protein (DUF305 family)